jgi:succinate dehydrogenase/fumarate reductase flavoprotein subunit
VPQWRQWGTGGLVVDWDLRSSLGGLYAAGGAVFGAGAHSSAAASGRYAGRRAAAAAVRADRPALDRQRVAAEGERVYAPLRRNGAMGSGGAIGWKELNAGICKVMQDYCGRHRSEGALRRGLEVLGSLRESEAAAASAANPHELARVAECQALIDVGEAVMHASLARRASCSIHDFSRLDFPADDPPEWRVLLAVRLRDGQAVAEPRPLDYHLLPPYAPSYEENYAAHGGGEPPGTEARR